MVTDAELIFWIVCGLVALFLTLSAPLFYNYLEYKRIEAMFSR